MQCTRMRLFFILDACATYELVASDWKQGQSARRREVIDLCVCRAQAANCVFPWSKVDGRIMYASR